MLKKFRELISISKVVKVEKDVYLGIYGLYDEDSFEFEVCSFSIELLVGDGYYTEFSGAGFDLEEIVYDIYDNFKQVEGDLDKFDKYLSTCGYFN